MKRSLLILIVILFSVITASCNMIGLMFEEDRDMFIGTWDENEEGEIYLFEENGSCDISDFLIGLKWSIDSNDKELKVWSPLWVVNIKADYDFEDSETLALTITELSALARECYSVGRTYYLYKR